MTEGENGSQLDDRERSASSFFSSHISAAASASLSTSPLSDAVLSDQARSSQQQQQLTPPPPPSNHQSIASDAVRSSNLPSQSFVAPPPHPFPVKANDVGNTPYAISSNTSSGSKHNHHHHHHQRSRSVNLSPTLPGGPFAAPHPMANLSWENITAVAVADADATDRDAARKRDSSPLLHALNPSAPRSNTMSRPASHPGPNTIDIQGTEIGQRTDTSATTSSASGLSYTPPFSSGSSSSSSSEASTPKSPELRRHSLSPADQRQILHSGGGWDSISKRSTSPARAFGIPLSPRLQAFGSNRTRRPSSSGSGSGKSGSMGSFHRPASPVPLPLSPRGTTAHPVPVNLDPEHPFDSVWPTESRTSPSSSPRTTELASRWSPAGGHGQFVHRTDSAKSPGSFGIVVGSSSGERNSPIEKTVRAPTPPFSGSPTLQRGTHLGGARHDPRKRLSGSSSQDSSPSSSWSPPNTMGLFPPRSSGQSTGVAQTVRSTSAASASFEVPANFVIGNSELSPILKVISPSKSTSQVDAQIAHGQVTPLGEEPSDEGQVYTSQGQDVAVQRRASSPSQVLRSGATSPSPQRPRTPKEGGSPSSSVNFAGASISPPKTRSFIGMPPRSGYDLSDDPDDVGSEDGASVSSREGSASNADDDDDDRDLEDTDADIEGQRDDSCEEDEQEGERAAFSADEEDAASSYRRKEVLRSSIEDEEGASDRQGGSSVPSFAARPVMPAKRPSLSRSSAVITPPMAPPSISSGGSVLRYFHDAPTSGDTLPWQKSSGTGPSSLLHTAPDTLESIAADELDLEAAQPNGTDALLSGSELSGDGGDASSMVGEGFTPDQPNAEAAATAISAEMENAEESLSTLERIFLFAKSEMTYHRVIVSRSLPVWIREVELSEAVEYVIPLLNGLATDEADVCLAFAAEVHHVMRYFYRNCPLVELGSRQDNQSQQLEGADAASESKEMATRPRVYVGIFTALLCALLLNQNPAVASTAQASVVTFFQMLHREGQVGDEVGDTSIEDIVVAHAEGRDGEPVAYEEYQFDQAAREAVIVELLEHVALAMGKANPSQDEERNPSEPSQAGGVNGDEAHTQGPSDAEFVTQDSTDMMNHTTKAGTKATPVTIHAGDDAEEDSSWDAEMQEESQSTDWRKGGSPFNSSSPMFSAYDQVDVDEEAAVGRMASVSLLGALSAEDAVSAETIRTRFLEEVVKFKGDSAFYVRKEVAVALGHLSRYLTETDLEQRLLPTFDVFCEDPIWHVRQAACAALPAIYHKVTGQLRRRSVVAHLRSFVHDVSRNVRTAALEIIGEAIYLFDGDEAGVPEELVRFFLGEPFDGTQGNDGQPAREGQGDERTPSPGSGSFLYADFGFGAALNGGAGGQDSLHASKESQWNSKLMSMHAESDAERPLIMAYNFPAVVLTLGGAAWPRLRQAHGELCHDTSPKVRQCLGASLHEIAKLLGPEATESDIMPVLKRYLFNGEDGEVKAAALENVHVTLAHLPKETALRELSALRDLWSTSFASDWRLREALALQIPSLADHFVLEDEEGSLMTIMQAALSDPVSSVRDAGVKAAPSLYKNFAEHDQTVADGVLGMLADMGESGSYRVRVGFLLAAYALVESRIQRSSFQLIVLPRLLSLGLDPVVDVRMALAKVAHLMCTLDELFASPQSRSPELLELLHTLATDSSALVRSTIGALFDAEDPILTATPQPSLQGRRDLVLGPASGGPHKPAKTQSTTAWDTDADQQPTSEAFAMDEDQRERTGELGVHQQYGVFEGDEGEEEDAEVVHMSEHDINSDLEMVDIEADSSMFQESDDEEYTPFEMHSAYEHAKSSTLGYSAEGPYDEAHGDDEMATGDVGNDSFSSQEEEPHHLMFIDDPRGTKKDDRSFAAVARGGSGSDPLGLSMNGFGGDGAHGEMPDPLTFSLTSPERNRGGAVAAAAGNQGVQDGGANHFPPLTISANRPTPTNGDGVASGEDESEGEDGGVSASSNGRSGSPPPPAVPVGDPSATSQDVAKPVDPFLSFVSGALSPAALKERGREADKGKEQATIDASAK